MGTRMIFCDTETTGLLLPSAAYISLQPHIIELSAIKTDKDCNIINEFNTFIKPPIPISEEITKITGITNEMVEDAPTFVEVYSDLSDYFLGEDEFVAHNATFDAGMIAVELKRIERLIMFPWPKKHICTVEASMPIQNRRLNLTKLYEKTTGKERQDAHRARGDVITMIECFKVLKEWGLV